MIEVVDYDPVWPAMAAAAIADVRGLFVDIEHIGSTSVPGLAAKPVIDLMAAVPTLAEVSADSLARVDFHPHDNGMTDRLLFIRTRDGVLTHNLHVVTVASWPTRNQRILRDYLREHPSDAARYAALKRKLAAGGIHHGDYAAAKTELIQELTDKARTRLGLPLVDVREK
ncbi:GrpB family protein [Kibdelosporangium philippinense]|uniref:GrpB family protein n=1 Tax=Kibdelosporangium philippinense TaxID=211113 RepID=A0ABS8ZPU9_9PSEU|nr:GrpB family protein [Kibdelosporangium philippinense]MCE7009780.1 GrpB family protein [Kibdelosporangium philippinense]